MPHTFEQVEKEVALTGRSASDVCAGWNLNITNFYAWRRNQKEKNRPQVVTYKTPTITAVESTTTKRPLALVIGSTEEIAELLRKMNNE